MHAGIATSSKGLDAFHIAIRFWGAPCVLKNSDIWMKAVIGVSGRSTSAEATQYPAHQCSAERPRRNGQRISSRLRLYRRCQDAPGQPAILLDECLHRSRPYRQIGFYRIVAGAVRKLAVIGQADRGALPNPPSRAQDEVEPRLDNAGIPRIRQPFDVKGLAAGKGQALRPGSRCQRHGSSREVLAPSG